ncbi:FecR family protein [Puteibacter caeruleilacunae]|nr:FecR family protein [Puteibacter caeruleilacunae]
MKREMKNSIDFKNIWRKIHLPNEQHDESSLRHWMGNRKKREQFYRDAEKYYLNGPKEKKTQDQIDASFANLSKKIAYRKFRRVVSRAAIVILIMGSSFWTWQRYIDSQQQDYSEAMSPGTDKAVLILDDGSSYDLTDEVPIVIKEKGTIIQSEGKSIHYKTTPKSSKKITYNTLSIPRGGQFFLTLSDSSRVWLNAESKIKYPVVFADNERVIELEGEAFFEVKKDKKRPFRVKTVGQMIEVLGTSFNVTAYHDEPFTTTTLVEGSVLVNYHDSIEKGIRLTPSQQSVLENETKKLTTQKVKTAMYTGWKDGNYYFHNETLEQIFKTLARWYDIKVEFKNPKTKHLCFTGSFDRNQDLSNIIKSIEISRQIKITAYENRLTIY